MTLPRTSLFCRNRGLYHYNKSPTKICGIFNYIAAMTQWGGEGCVVSRVGVGDYLITMDDQDITQILSCVCCAETAGTTDLVVKADTVTMGPPTTIQVTSWAANVATELTATENIHFEITFEQGTNNEPDSHPRGFYHMTANTTNVCGSITIGAAGAVGALTGRGYTAALTGAGIYTITFDDGFTNLLSGTCTCPANAVNNDTVAQFGAFTPGLTGAATLVIRTKTAGAQAVPAATSVIQFDVNLASNAADV